MIPRHLRPDARGRKGSPDYTARYYDLLPEPPTTHTRAAATAFHLRIVDVLERPGWTRQERANLGRLERRWRRRAAGEDPRWLLTTGRDRGGRLPAEAEASLEQPAHPAWTAPLDSPDDGSA